MKKRIISITFILLLVSTVAVGCKKKEDRLSGPYDTNKSYTDEIDGTTTSDNTVEVDLETGKIISMPSGSSKTESGKEQVGEDDLPSKTTDSKSSSSAGSSSSDKSNSSSSSSSSSSGKDNSNSSSSDDNKQSMDGWEPWR